MKDTTKGPRYSVIPSRAVYDQTLPPRALRVLAALGVHSNNDGWCFPDQATLARDLQIARPRVSTAIVMLVERGYVECDVRVIRGKGKRGLWYRVILDVPGKRPPDVDTISGAAVTKSEHRAGREQNGESHPLLPKANTGADVTKTQGPMLPNGNSHIIAEQSHRNEVPHSPPQAGEAKKRNPKTKRSAKRTTPTRPPPEFVEAWTLWPRPGSNQERALKAWRAHRASGKQKLAAVKAYLASKQAQAENGRYVTYMQRWLTSSLGSFVEVAQRTDAARKARAEAKPVETRKTIYCRECRTDYIPGEQRCNCPQRSLLPALGR